MSSAPALAVDSASTTAAPTSTAATINGAGHCKRRARSDASEAGAANEESGASEEPPSKHPRLSHSFKIDEDDLKCVVCLEFPVGKIVQCPNGHLLCDECHDRVVEAYQCVCPTCRAKLSRDHPSRNRFAESVLSTVIVPCSNAGCSERLPFGKVRDHASETCPFRLASCKFSPLGCDWNDIHSKLKAHERDCSLRQKSAKSILKRVLERTSQANAEERRKRQEVQSQIKIAELLSSRCRDIIFREVLIERDTICDVICSKPFKAFGSILSLELDLQSPNSNSSDSSSPEPNAPATETTSAGAATAGEAKVTTSASSGDKNVGLILTQRSRHSKRMRLTVFMLKGPDSEITNFTPIIQPVSFSRTKRTSNLFPLPLTQSQAKDMFEMGSLTIRIGLIDRRRGVARSFSNDGASGRADDEDDDSYSSSSDDDDGIVSDDPDAMDYYSTSSDDEDCIHAYMDDDDHGDSINIF